MRIANGLSVLRRKRRVSVNLFNRGRKATVVSTRQYRNEYMNTSGEINSNNTYNIIIH